jgi:4,5-DOPA dioxygenase extradiol
MENRIFPVLFVSHGAPSLAMEKNETVKFLQKLGSELGRPKSILCVSAHWSTSVPTVSGTREPETIHDFGGFASELYEMRYSPPGATALAERVVDLLEEKGFDSDINYKRGLDHGAWVPLKLIYPEATIPVAQLSIQGQSSPAHHFRVGQAIADIRTEGTLILATGSVTHNLSELGDGGPPPDWAQEFDNWLYEKVTQGQYEELMNYRELGPSARLAHPTEDHLLPLFVAMGAGVNETDARGQNLHRGWTYKSLSMAAYSFGSSNRL